MNKELFLYRFMLAAKLKNQAPRVSALYRTDTLFGPISNNLLKYYI